MRRIGWSLLAGILVAFLCILAPRIATDIGSASHTPDRSRSLERPRDRVQSDTTLERRGLQRQEKSHRDDGRGRREIARRIEERLESLSEGEVMRELDTWAGVDEEWLKRDGIETRSFARRLIEIAADGFSKKAGERSAVFDPESDESLDAFDVSFSSSLDDRNGAWAPTRSFSPSDIRIFAHVPSDAIEVPYRPVLVRWIDIDRGEIEMMQAVRLAPDAGSGTRNMSMRRLEGWTVGRRRVELYALEEGAPLLATGEFEITAEELPWPDSASSIELFAIDTELANGPIIDAIGSPDDPFRLAVRGGFDLTGAVLRLSRVGEVDDALEFEMHPAKAGPAWWTVDIDGLPGAGVWIARIDRFGSQMEQRAFRVLNR